MAEPPAGGKRVMVSVVLTTELMERGPCFEAGCLQSADVSCAVYNRQTCAALSDQPPKRSAAQG